MKSSKNAIHPTAWVDPGAKLGSGIVIGAQTVVHDGVEIGDDSVIQEQCLIGLKGVIGESPLVIGPGSVIRSHTVIYRSSSFGERLETGHHVVIRENTKAGINLRVGNLCDIEGDCTLGDFCRLHGYVHVGKGSHIGNFVWLFSLCTTTNDPLPPSLLQIPVTIEDGAVVCVGVTLMPGAIVGQGAFICAGARAKGIIPPGAVVEGSDGRIVNHVCHLLHMQTGSQHPWMRHYRKGYPPEAIVRLEALEREILKNRYTLKIGDE